ncbi:hypothetical protein [Achromobacter xylosoxidans]|uniref:hypothetical protein n=1 Tax=Alcaligenes xylosoxydans xylosoxydans TaxID=85698 RepID=UPI0038FCCC7A
MSKMTLESKRFVGSIAARGEIVPLVFDVSAGEDGRPAIEPLPLDVQNALTLQTSMGEPGSYLESLCLKGDAEDGSTFFSDTTELHGIRQGMRECSISLRARQATIEINFDPPVKPPLMRLWFRGFKSFRNAPVLMSLGTVQVVGPNKLSSQDEMAGYVAIQAPEGVIASDWLNKADKFLTFMHRGLAFAHGGRLQTPRLDELVESRWKATFYDGEGYPKSLAPIHFLNQEPFIKALVARFEESSPFPDMLWTAVGWLHSFNSFDEVRYLVSMTALETVIEHVIPKKQTTVISKPAFAPIRDRLLTALEGDDLAGAARDIFVGRLKGLNSRTLSQKMQALRDHYGLPADVFSDEAITGITKARNNIVHTGASKESQDLFQKEIFIREFITRIVFHEVGYNGPYESYVNGYRSIHSQAAGKSPEFQDDTNHSTAGSVEVNQATDRRF